jgi:hypothetical protein
MIRQAKALGLTLGITAPRQRPGTPAPRPLRCTPSRRARRIVGGTVVYEAP